MKSGRQGSRTATGVVTMCGLFALGGIAAHLGSPAARAFAATDPAQPAFFSERVQPVLQANCFRCHAGMNHRGGLSMATRDLLLKGGNHGPAIVPGHPEQSLLVKLIRHEGPADDPMNMPPSRPKISDSDIVTIEAWIKAGAAMPPGPVALGPGR